MSSHSTVLLQADVQFGLRFFYFAILATSALILVLVVGMLGILIQKNRNMVRTKQLQHQFKDWLVEVILEETDENHVEFATPDVIKKLLDKRFAQQALLQELKRQKYSLSGQPGENLEKLYSQLGLHTLSARDLRSSQWHLKAKGIQELSVMNQLDFVEEIIPLTNHKNPEVRMEAQIALVFLQQYNGLHFFENLIYPLTEWHQVKLLQLLASQPIPSHEAITRWLQSSNASVVQFALKLIGEQHAESFQNEVITCLGHADEKVRRQAINCLGEIPSTSAANALKHLFTLETSKSLKMSILSELVKTGATDDLPFLQSLQQDSDLEISFAASKTLRYLENQAVA